MVSETERRLRDLSQKDFPEIAGVKPFFAPGVDEIQEAGGDMNAAWQRYSIHNISGKGKPLSDARIERYQLTHEIDTLSAPDAVFVQQNGNRYYATTYAGDKNNVLHVVIAETEDTGRVREVTQFVYEGGRGNHSIKNQIEKKLKDSQSIYVGEDIKKATIRARPLAAPSALHGVSGTLLASIDDIVSHQNESIKLGMSQKAHNLQARQRADMERYGIPLGDVSAQDYAYAPHLLTKDATRATDQAATIGLGPQVSGPSKHTPRAQHRDVMWIDDGKRAPFIGSLEKHAGEVGRDPRSFKTWQASVDEVNDPFDKPFEMEGSQGTWSAARWAG